MDTCMTCMFFTGLGEVKDTIDVRLYWAITPGIFFLIAPALGIWVVVTGVKNWFAGGEMDAYVKKVFLRLLIAAFIASVMLWGGPGSVPLIHSKLIYPMEDFATSLGAQIIRLGDGTAPIGGDNGYVTLGYQVESLILGLLEKIARLMNRGQILDGTVVGRIIAGLLIMLPYLFVWGITVAFWLEAMFKFVAAGIFSPIALPALLFEPTRAFAWAMLRILVGAMLTIVFAAGALAFTMGVVGKYGHSITTTIEGPSNSDLNRARVEAQTICNVQEQQRSEAGWVDDGYDACAEANARVERLREDAAAAEENGFALFSKDFFFLFVIGLASVLLHLQAKSLASNISGANDGAGPAAATVAAGKALLAYGAMAGSRGTFGSGGAGTSLSAAMNSNPLTSAIHQHGVAGGVASALKNTLYPGSSSGGGAPTPAGAGMFSGGGGNPASFDRLGAAMEDLAKALEKRTR